MPGGKRVLLLGFLLLTAPVLAGCTDARDDDDGDEGKNTPGPGGRPGPGSGGGQLPGLLGVELHSDDTSYVSSEGLLYAIGFAGVPSFRQVETGFDGAEPSIGVTPSGNIFVVASTATLRSSDKGLTWEAVKRDPVTADPLLWVDRDTGRVFTNQLYVGCSYLHYSDDEGQTWSVNPVACGLPVNDHQKMTTAPRNAANQLASYENVVYYCASQILAAQCSVSHDGGTTFLGTFAVPPGACGGLHGMPWGAADGTVYLPYIGCDRPAVAVSTDDGVSWTIREGPDDKGGGGFDPDVVTTTDGTVYLLYTGADHLPYLIRSTDAGASWDGPFRVSPPGMTSSVFAAAAAGDDGRIALTYIGSRDHTGDPDKAKDTATWDLYAAFPTQGTDDGPLFVTVQTNPIGDPVQRGRICTQGAECKDSRNLLDFMDVTIDHEGRLYVTSADGCVSKVCQDGDATKSDAQATTVWILEEGPGMYARMPWLQPFG